MPTTGKCSDVPIIILNWNGWDDTIQCVRSLQDLGGSYRIWVVDNNSAIDRSEEVLRVDNRVVFVRNDRNYGWAGGYNIALRKAHSLGHTFAYLLNNDTIVPGRFLEPLIDAAREDESLAAVGSVIGSYKPQGFVRFDGQYYRPGEKALSTSNELRYVDDVNGSGMLVRLEATRLYGYFDERYFCYGEEREWCHRLSRQGLRVAVSSASLILHKVAGSDSNCNQAYYMIRNRFIDHESRGQTSSSIVVASISSIRELYPRRTWNSELHRALIQALNDGVNGRFGERVDTRVRFADAIKFDCLVLATALYRVLRHFPGGTKIVSLAKDNDTPARLLRDVAAREDGQ